jgi:hypothetical protein
MLTLPLLKKYNALNDDFRHWFVEALVQQNGTKK